MAEFTVTADRWKVHVTDGHTVAEYEIEGGSADEAKAAAADMWQKHENRERSSTVRARAAKAEADATKAHDAAVAKREADEARPKSSSTTSGGKSA